MIPTIPSSFTHSDPRRAALSVHTHEHPGFTWSEHVPSPGTSPGSENGLGSECEVTRPMNLQEFNVDPHFGVNYDATTGKAFIYHVPSGTPFNIRCFEDTEFITGGELAALFLQWTGGKIPPMTEGELRERRREFGTKIHDEHGSVTDEMHDAVVDQDAGIVFESVCSAV